MIGCIDILNRQMALSGMERKALKRDFGQHLIFHGGVDNQHTLVLAHQMMYVKGKTIFGSWEQEVADTGSLPGIFKRLPSEISWLCMRLAMNMAKWLNYPSYGDFKL